MTLCRVNVRSFSVYSALNARRWQKELAFQSELKNPAAKVYGSEVSDPDSKGFVFDKKPFKVSVKKYHLYEWCGCGRSHSQPFCDHTCQNNQLSKVIFSGPVKYIAPEDRDVWFCMCKQTNNRPFCDGSHRNPEIQEMRIDGKFNLWEPKSDEKVDKLTEVDEISDEELLFGDLEEEAKKKK